MINIETEKQWPFTDAPKTAVYTTRDIIEKGKPILIVTHDQDDGAWQFHTENTTWRTDARIAALEEIVFRDPSVIELSDLPIGWMAIRDSKEGPWVRQPIPSNVTAQQQIGYDDGQSPGNHAVRKYLASPNAENIRSTTFTVVDAFDIKGRGVVIVGDKTFLDFLEIKPCDVEITIPTGDVLRCIAFKEWLLPSSTPRPDDTEAFFIRGRSKSEIPIGSIVKVTQA